MKKKYEKSAFILVEIIVVLFIVSMGMLGVVSLLIQNIKSQDYNKNSIIANQLAQEGIELIRRVRDSNWLEEGYAWFQNLSEEGKYYMSFSDDIPRVLNQEADSILYFNGSYYKHDQRGVISPFQRVIHLSLIEEDPRDPDPENQSLLVKSEVTWREHKQTKTYFLETILYNWK